jgi:transcriptional regulator with XRE-family HTH domain
MLFTFCEYVKPSRIGDGFGPALSGFILAVPIDLRQIAARLTLLRKALRLSQAELCRQTEIAPNQWNQFETGKRRITLEVAAKLKERYGASLDWIYVGDSAGIPQALLGQLFPAQPARKRQGSRPPAPLHNGK